MYPPLPNVKPTRITKMVIHCARCTQTHEVEFQMFKGNPVVDEDGRVWDYWALCPTNGDPILLTFESSRAEE